MDEVVELILVRVWAGCSFDQASLCTLKHNCRTRLLCNVIWEGVVMNGGRILVLSEVSNELWLCLSVIQNKRSSSGWFTLIEAGVLNDYYLFNEGCCSVAEEVLKFVRLDWNCFIAFFLQIAQQRSINGSAVPQSQRRVIVKKAVDNC